MKAMGNENKPINASNTEKTMLEIRAQFFRRNNPILEEIPHAASRK